MTKKTFFAGDIITPEDCSFGLGSIYLAGPGYDWRDKLIDKINCDCSIFNHWPAINTGKKLINLNNKTTCKIPYTQTWQWEAMAMSMASVIVFWFPKNEIDEKSLVDFGIWSNSERVFLGIENKSEGSYPAHLLYQNHRLYPAETLDQLAEMVTHWMKE